MPRRKTYMEKLKDPRWQKRRLEILEAAEFRCRDCGDAESTLHVHHGYYRKGADPWDYEDEYLQCLCETCHERAEIAREEAYRMIATMRPSFLEALVPAIHGLCEFGSGIAGYLHDSRVIDPIASRRRALLAAGVPERFAALDFAEPNPWPRAIGQDTDQSINQWSGHPELLTFAGPTDTGKTTLAVEMLWRYPGRRAWTVAGRIPALLIHGEAGEWQRLTESDVLLVDELGRGHNRDGWEYVYSVVAERWNWRRPTILTTNLTLDQLEAAHPALYRRLQEGWIVPLGKNWRTRTKEAT